ncbi:MAG: radical SAM family heme chaperone HemW [Deltaproteobacteria bacterium]|nr:radical SAM family heme chaperone HemW [Deltaproteobacteria bacterium]
MEIRDDTIGVYVHIPYCISKCPYCNFSSAAISSPPEKRYSDCVIKELSFYLETEGLNGRRLETVYIGGGTPSIFSPEEIGRVISSIKGRFIPLGNDIEVTLEVNPDTVDLKKLAAYARGGVTRLSIGAQSFSDVELESIGRTHSARRALDAFHEAREAGSRNIGVDLIFGLPGQREKDWESSVRKAIGLRPEHISVYGLTIEEGTPFFSAFKGRAGLPSEEAEAAMYERAIYLLQEAGYIHYEISNFALPGKTSVHNSRYWADKDYLGLGASAHSYISRPGWGRRWWNAPDPREYMRAIENAGTARVGEEKLRREEAMTEAMMLGLRRLDKGIEGRAFKERFGSLPKESFKRWEALHKDGLLNGPNDDIVLTPKGVLLSNEVFLKMAEGCL